MRRIPDRHPRRRAPRAQVPAGDRRPGPAAEVTIDKVVAGGDGLARLDDGRVVLVDGALPGERVRARLVDERRDFARATVEEVIEPHAARIAAPCPMVAAGCGGCTWQHITPAYQRELRRSIVVDALVRTGGIADPEVHEAAALPVFGYRTTMRLAAGEDGRLGFRRRRSHRVVTVSTCPIASPALDGLLAAARLTPGAEVVLRASIATGERTARVVGRGELSDVLDDVAVGADASLVEVVAGERLDVGAGSFFQTRHDGAEALVAAVRRQATGSDGDALVVDAYGGVGMFAVTSLGSGPVVSIESSPSSSADASRNLARWSLRIGRDARSVKCDVERWEPERAGLVVADPPRGGLDREAAGVLARCGAPVLVLVSCDPVSLARDARLLAAHGYRHRGSELVDLFPHTPHVEVVTRFERAT